MNRKLIFDAAKRRGAVFKTGADVADMDAAIDAAFAPTDAPTAPIVPISGGRSVSQRGIDLMHQFESCKLEAYKDPGSKDGLPITIGWGSTSNFDGTPIRLGMRWTQEQCDARYATDLAKFAAQVDKAIGAAPTTQHQFDAMVSLAYNIGAGRGGLATSTVLRKHKAGDYIGAANAFVMWNKNDGKVMRGLTRRRLAEADLYDDV